MSRRTLLHRPRAARRGARRRRADGDPGVASAPEADARARPAGRPRGHAPGGPAAEPRAHERRSRPLGRHHAEPRRQARRDGARDPHAGLEPDRDPASGGQGSRGGREDHRHDRAARALRPRRRPSSARRSPFRATRCEHTSLYDLLAEVQSQVKDGKSDAWYVVNTKTKRVVSGPFATEAEALQEGQAAEPRGLRRPRRDGRDHVRQLESRTRREPSSARAGSRKRRLARPDVLLPLQVRPAERPADDGRGPEALRDARRLRHEPGRGRRADRDAWSSRARARTKFEKITRDEWIRGKLTNAPQHFCDRPRPRDQDVPADRLHATRASRAASAAARRPDRRASTRCRRRRTSRSCSRPARCRSSSRRSTAPTSRRRSGRTR